MPREVRLMSVRSGERVNSAKKAKSRVTKKSDELDERPLTEAEIRDVCEFTRNGGSVDDWIERNSLEI